MASRSRRDAVAAFNAGAECQDLHTPGSRAFMEMESFIDNVQKCPGMTAGVISIGLVVKTKPLPSAAELRRYCGLKCDDASAARSHLVLVCVINWNLSVPGPFWLTAEVQEALITINTGGCSRGERDCNDSPLSPACERSETPAMPLVPAG